MLEREASLRGFLEAVGAREGDASTKLLRGRGRGPLMAVWYDAARPAASAERVAVGVAQLAGDDAARPVSLYLHGVEARDARAAIVLRLANELFRTSGMPQAEGMQRVTFFGLGSRGDGEAAEALGACALEAAELVNLPSNVLYPRALAGRLASWLGACGRVTVLEGPALRRARLGLVEGVGGSGEHAPCVLVLEPARRDRTRPLVLLVGKGVTYDSGGLALKPLPAMAGMQGDMAGAAVAAAVARLSCGAGDRPFDVAAVLPMAENLVSARAVRPSDVLRACDGTTVEVNNPDAEGRLLLADAVAYGCARFSPDAVVDFGTLTGTAEGLHPGLQAAFYAEDDRVARAVSDAGEAAGERAWRMPPWGGEDEHLLSSTTADCRNTVPGTRADGYVAALFIRRFVPPELRARWVHIDLASYSSATGGLLVCGGAALGARLLPGLAVLARSKDGEKEIS